MKDSKHGDVVKDSEHGNVVKDSAHGNVGGPWPIRHTRFLTCDRLRGPASPPEGMEQPRAFGCGRTRLRWPAQAWPRRDGTVTTPHALQVESDDLRAGRGGDMPP